MYPKIVLGLIVLGTSIGIGAFTALWWNSVEGETLWGAGQEAGVRGTGGASDEVTTADANSKEDTLENGVRREKNAPAETPAYETLRDTGAEGVRELVLSTDATDLDGMRRIAEELRYYAPQDGVLLLEFRQTAEPSTETGFALIFESREAALAPDLPYDREEAKNIVEEDGGIRVISYEEFREQNPELQDDLERWLT